MKLWIYSDVRFGKYKTIKNKITKELECNGKYGMIWEHSDTHYKACITSVRVAKKLGIPCAKGDEPIIIFPKEEIKKYGKLLKISSQQSPMIKRASAFTKIYHVSDSLDT